MKLSPEIKALADILAGITATAAVCAAFPATAAADHWRWLEDTYWYVPTEYLLAIASSPALKSPIPVSDQTVYHIARYAGGYFWGTTAVSYTPRNGSTGSEPSCLQLVGSVTPEGRLHLTFTLLPKGTTGGGSSTSPTVGLGTMTRQWDAWTMENQMSTTAVKDVLLTQWAYMHQCKSSEPCFAELPGVGLSIPEILAPCEQAEAR
ncbi:MAG: hypothetical protein WA184_14020 [Stellaceae bacterium]